MFVKNQDYNGTQPLPEQDETQADSTSTSIALNNALGKTNPQLNFNP